MPVFLYMAEGKRNFVEFLKKWSIPLITGSNAAKLFFLFLSVFLWFLINLAKEGYIDKVSFPVNYTSVPPDLRLTNNPPEELRVSLRGKGFEILKLKRRSIRPVEIAIDELKLADTTEYTWNTDDRMQIIEEELGEDISVIDIEPEQITFKFSPIEERRFKVYLKGKKNFSKFKTFYKPPEINPDSISIWGTGEELQQIDSVFTETLSLTAEEDSLIRKVKLALPDEEGLEFSQREVEVKLRYTSLTEGSLNVPLQIRNLPAGYALTLIPRQVKVTFRVPVEDFARVKASDFSVYVDYASLKAREREFLPVQVSQSPDYVRKLDVEPKKVEYILTRQ